MLLTNARLARLAFIRHKTAASLAFDATLGASKTSLLRASAETVLWVARRMLTVWPLVPNAILADSPTQLASEIAMPARLAISKACLASRDAMLAHLASSVIKRACLLAEIVLQASILAATAPLPALIAILDLFKA